MAFFRTIISLIMIMLIPALNLFDGLVHKTQEGIFTDYSHSEKQSRYDLTYSFDENDILLSLTGSDDNSGSESSPMKSISAALDKVKETRLSGNDNKITLWLKGGDYQIGDTLFFDESTYNLSFCAVPGEKVSLSGTYDFASWSKDEFNGIECLSAPLPQGMKFNSLFKNDEALPMTRYPENGYLKVASNCREDSVFNDDNRTWEYCYGDVSFIPEDGFTLREIKNQSDVWVKILHYWMGEVISMESFEPSTRKIRLKNPCSMRVEAGDRFFLENVAEAFDSPGEWYADSSTGKLYYIPTSSDVAENLTLSAPVLTTLLEIKNTRDITFYGITFKNTDWRFPNLEKDGFLGDWSIRFPQGELDHKGTAEITDSNNIVFECCDFLNCGTTGLRLEYLVKDTSVKKCTFKNIGANAITIKGYNAVETERITENITVTDCLIDGYGQHFPSGIGIISTHARGCDFSNNEICNGCYSAYSVGWVWGFNYSVSENNRICNNYIHDIGQGWLSDMGGIYTLGIQRNTVISGNVIRNVAADPGEGGYGGWGIYLDEGSSYITVENNLSYDCGSEGFHQHYGEENLIRNNIFAFSDEAQVRLSRMVDDRMPFTFTGNIVVTKDRPVFASLNKNTFNEDKNLYWDYKDGKYFYSSADNTRNIGQRLYPNTMKMMGFLNNSVTEDPLFRNPEEFDFTLADNSPAIEKMGFKKWDYSLAGPRVVF